jgi:hypothetical protein
VLSVPPRGPQVDPTLTRADRLVGQVLGAVGNLPDVYRCEGAGVARGVTDILAWPARREGRKYLYCSYVILQLIQLHPGLACKA